MKNLIKVEIECKTPEIAQIFEKCLSEVEGFEVLAPGAGGADLLIAELGEDSAKYIEGLHELRLKSPLLEIFLSAAAPESGLLIQAMRAGVREFFPQPLQEEEIRLSLWRFKDHWLKQGRGVQSAEGVVVNVIGAKGGIGTTTIAVNLAASFMAARKGASAVIMDMNLPYGEVQLFLDLKPKYHWGEVVRTIGRLDAAYLMGVLSKHSSGLYILPPPSQLEDLQMATPETISKLLDLLRRMFDTVIIDLGMYLDEVTLKVMEISDIILLITGQNLNCVANMKRFLEHIRQSSAGKEDKLKLVVNRYLAESELTVEDMEEAVGRKCFWRVPNDYKTTLDAINQGKSLLETAPKAQVTKSLSELALAVYPSKTQAPKKGGLLGLNLFKKKPK